MISTEYTLKSINGIYTVCLIVTQKIYTLVVKVIRYCLDATSHLRGEHTGVQVNIYVHDQAKSFELRELTQELTQPCKHLFRFKQ